MMRWDRKYHFAFALFQAVFVSACVYTPPPQVELLRPDGGVFYTGDDLVFQFSDPVNPQTLVINVWPGERDVEGQLVNLNAPLVEGCTQEVSPCGDAELEVSEDNRSAVLLLDSQTVGQPDVPLVIEVSSGLCAESVCTGTSLWFDVQFKPEEEEIEGTSEGVEFTNGVYILVATVEDPLPTTIRLVTDIKVIDDGTLALAGAESKPIGDAPNNTMVPEELAIDTTEGGFAVFAQGRVVSADDQRFMETDPFALVVTVGPLVVTLTDLQLTGLIEQDTDTGLDRIEGTLSYLSVSLQSGSAEPFIYEAGTTTFSAVYTVPERVPEGAPDVCGDLCGAVTSQCNPPADFPPDGFCGALQ